MQISISIDYACCGVKLPRCSTGFGVIALVPFVDVVVVVVVVVVVGGGREQIPDEADAEG